MHDQDSHNSPLATRRVQQSYRILRPHTQCFESLVTVGEESGEHRLGLLSGPGPRYLRLVERGAPVPGQFAGLALLTLALLALQVLAPPRARALLRVRLHSLGCGHSPVHELSGLLGAHSQGTRHLVVLA